MYKHIAYGGVLVAAAVALSGLGVGGARASASRAGAVPGTQLWVQRYNGPANGDDKGTSVAVSPAGATVFVTGSRDAANGKANYATVAYNAATGAQLWVQGYNGPANGADGAVDLAVSPRGDRVFVTGASAGTTGGGDYATVAYNAATGAQLWVQRYNGPANGDDKATSLAVSPAGGTVFVTGSRDSANGKANYATVAYNAATGARLWVSRYNGPTNGDDKAKSVAVSPSGSTVYVTGNSQGTTGRDYVTVAYNAATGAQRWAHRWNGPGNNDDDLAYSVAVSPDGGTVFVTGDSYVLWRDAYATVAYNAATGAQLWAKVHFPHPNDGARSVAVSPTGSTVYVTGESGTLAYNAATGAQLWTASYLDSIGYPAHFASMTVSPNGGTVYVTGTTSGYDSAAIATVAYNAATGAQLWAQQDTGPYGAARSVAVSPRGDKVFVTGYSNNGPSSYDYATIAYSG